MSGSLAITVVEARNLTNKDGLFGKNDAYAIVKVAGKKEKTNVLENAGKNANWNQTFNFQVGQNEEVHVEVYDHDKIKDDLIGSVKIPTNGIFQQGYSESWYPLSCGAKNGGEILLRFQFQNAGTYAQGANVPN